MLILLQNLGTVCLILFHPHKSIISINYSPFPDSTRLHPIYQAYLSLIGFLQSTQLSTLYLAFPDLPSFPCSTQFPLWASSLLPGLQCSTRLPLLTFANACQLRCAVALTRQSYQCCHLVAKARSTPAPLSDTYCHRRIRNTAIRFFITGHIRVAKATVQWCSICGWWCWWCTTAAGTCAALHARWELREFAMRLFWLRRFHAYCADARDLRHFRGFWRVAVNGIVGHFRTELGCKNGRNCPFIFGQTVLTIVFH